MTRPTLRLGVAVLATTLIASAGAAAPSFAYELEYEIFTNGRREVERLLYDRGRFRLERLGSDRRPVGAVELHDGSDPHLMWLYSPTNRRAYPDPSSATRALSAAAARLGEAEVRRRYSVPPKVTIVRMVGGRAAPQRGVLLLRDLGSGMRLEGTGETVAGASCKVYSRVTPGRREGTVVTPQTVEANPTVRLRVWADEKSGLVLRMENLLQFDRATGMPPIRTLFRALRFRRLSRVDPASFRLPAGAEAHVPALFQNVTLPRGVKRVQMTGPYAQTGIDYGSGG